MVPQPLCLVDEVAIVGTGHASYLDMTLDGGCRVLFQRASVLGRERPACALVQRPVFVAYPFRRLVGVSLPCPAPQHAVESVVALTEYFLCDHCAVVVCPAGDEWVQLPNQRFVRRLAVLMYYPCQLSDMLFDGFFAGCDDGFESQGFPMRAL